MTQSNPERAAREAHIPERAAHEAHIPERAAHEAHIPERAAHEAHIPERAAREAHIKELEADTRKEQEKAQERSGDDREVEQELQTVTPGSDAPSRAGITPSGSGADRQ